MNVPVLGKLELEESKRKRIENAVDLKFSRPFDFSSPKDAAPGSFGTNARQY